MRKTLALLALASALPLAAQSFEAGLLYTWNPGHDSSITSGSATAEFKADTWKAAGVRFGYNFVHIGPMEIQGNATYQFSNTQDLTAKSNGVPQSLPGVTEGYKYWAVGAAVNWDFLVRLGLGLEYRSENLTLDDPLISLNQSTTYGRGWIRGTAGFTIPAPIVKPFVGVEAAFPLSSKNLSASDLMGSSTSAYDNLNKSLAPKAQYGIYAGIRF